MKPNWIRFLFLALVSGAVAFGCAAQTSFFKAGEEQAAQGKWVEAYASLQAAQLKEPGNLAYKLALERARPRAAEVHYRAGKKLFDEGKYDQAVVELQLALAIDPNFQRAEQLALKVKNYQDAEFYYQKGVQALKENEERKALIYFRKAASLNPNHEGAQASFERLKNKESIQSSSYELELKSREPITLKFRDASFKEVLSALSKLSGINFIYDEAYKDIKVTISLEGVTFKQALDMLFIPNPLFYKVISKNSILVAPKIAAKVRQYEDLKVRTFYLETLDVKKAAALVRTVLKTETVYVNEELNALIVRADPERLELVEKTLEANDLPVAEVVYDVEIVEMNRTRLRQLGLELSRYAISTQAGKTPETRGSRGPARPLIADVLPGQLGFPTAAPTSEQLINFLTLQNLAGNRLIFFTLPSATFRFLKSVTDARILTNPTVRVSNGVKASIHVGEKVPVITTTVTPGGVTSESVQYLDTGVRLDVTPTIHLDDEITTKVRLEASSVSQQVTTASGGTAFRLSTRTSDTVLRVKEGETQIMGGLISDDERTSVIKVAGLGDIPILGRLFTVEDKTRISGEILLSITPRISRSIPLPRKEVTDFWSGRETEYSTRPLFMEEEQSLPPEGKVQPDSAAQPGQNLSSLIPAVAQPPEEERKVAETVLTKGDDISEPGLVPGGETRQQPLTEAIVPATSGKLQSSEGPGTGVALPEPGQLRERRELSIAADWALMAKKEEPAGPGPVVKSRDAELPKVTPSSTVVPKAKPLPAGETQPQPFHEAVVPATRGKLQSSEEPGTEVALQEPGQLRERKELSIATDWAQMAKKEEPAGPGPVVKSRDAELPKVTPSSTVVPEAKPLPREVYFVQVGSFRSLENARKLMARLDKRGFQSYLSNSLAEKGWHRVLVGYFYSRAEAEAVAAEIKARENLSQYIIWMASGPSQPLAGENIPAAKVISGR